YAYQSKYFSIRAFASPVNIPERGAPIRAQDGKLISANPDAAIQYESVSVMNAQVPIRYSIEMPAMEDLLLHSSALAQVHLGQKNTGLWASYTAGFKPINSPDITAEATLKLTPTEYIDAKLYPRITRHELMMVETGLKTQRIDFWASLIRETPKAAPVAQGQVAAPMGPALIASGGFDARIQSSTTLRAGILSINEKLSTASDNGVTINLPGRYRFKRAASLNLDWQAHSRLHYSVGWLRDWGGNGQWISTQGEYRFKNSGWSLGLGAELYNRAPRDSFFGPYAGNDRVEGRLSYAF
ncbi:MAG: hypothetical protein KGQ59_12515, partial [Bdellovibrionales bacterium]|nr:hypothetical protein [Bdellovibrionales bacterium]